MCRRKPRFFKPAPGTLIKATRPWERLSIDFKGHVRGPNHTFSLQSDEYSRFPFVFACSSTTTKTVVDCLNNLFCLFGFPAYVHSDRGSSFMSLDLKVYFAERGVRTNQTVWKTRKLLLHHRGWPDERWQDVLQQALHAMRSLICTATNETAHERMFPFQRRATSGTVMPTWLLAEGPVLLRCHVRNTGDRLCDEVLLLEANLWYEHIQHGNGREDTVSTSDLAPCPNAGTELDNSQVIPAVEAEAPTNIPEEEPPADAYQHKPVNDAEPDF